MMLRYEAMLRLIEDYTEKAEGLLVISLDDGATSPERILALLRGQGLLDLIAAATSDLKELVKSGRYKLDAETLDPLEANKL